MSCKDRVGGPVGVIRPFVPTQGHDNAQHDIAEALDHIARAISALDDNLEILITKLDGDVCRRCSSCSFACKQVGRGIAWPPDQDWVKVVATVFNWVNVVTNVGNDQVERAVVSGRRWRDWIVVGLLGSVMLHGFILALWFVLTREPKDDSAYFPVQIALADQTSSPRQPDEALVPQQKAGMPHRRPRSRPAPRGPTSIPTVLK